MKPILDNSFVRLIKAHFIYCGADFLFSKQIVNVNYFCLQIRLKLTLIFGDTKASLDVIAFTAISLGLVFVGSCNEDVAQAIIFALMDRSESDLGEPLARLLCLGLGLLYLGKQVVYILYICNLNK